MRTQSMQFPERVTLLGRQLRVLVSSNNANLNWDLRCKVREALVE